MMSQEEFMDVMALRRRGWTIEQIADEVGRHPQTVSKWIKAGGPPAKRQKSADEQVIDERWQRRIAELLENQPQLLATSIMRLLEPEGFNASYPTLTRHLRSVRGPRTRKVAAVTVPIETVAGEEAQADFANCVGQGMTWGLGRLFCFSVVLSWSRYRRWWFLTAEDQAHALEGLVRFFEHIGGVPGTVRIDNLTALVAKPAPRFRLQPAALEFARAHGTKLVPCLPGDAKRKGKVERPFRDMREALFAELTAQGPPASIAELNRRAQDWLDCHVHARVHRVTGETPADRLVRERPTLGALPRNRYDTARVETRTVGQVPLVTIDGARYSVPPEFAGTRVKVRLPAGGAQLEVHSIRGIIAVHPIVAAGTTSWEPSHRAAVERLVLTPNQRDPRQRLRLVAGQDVDAQHGRGDRLQLGEGDYDVAAPDLAARYGLEDGEGA